MKRTLKVVLVFILLASSVLSLGMNSYLYKRVVSLEKQIGTNGQQPSSSQSTQVNIDVTDSTVDVVKKVQSSVVTIGVMNQGYPKGSGSGVVYQKDGNKYYVVTNHHVVDGGDSISVLFTSGENCEAKLLGSDQITDLAVLEIEPEFEVNVIEIGDSNLLDVGETVLAIGSPLGADFNGSTTKGIVSGTNRIVSVDLNNDGQEDWDMNVVQVDAAINPGNSGGALINMAGQLVGITSMKITSTDNMGFAIPISEAISSLEQLKVDGKISRPVLGVSVIAMSNITVWQRYYNNIQSDSNDGVYVYSCQEGSPADKGGLQKGDVIMGLNENKITTYKSFLSALYQCKVGDEIQLDIERDGKIISLKIVLE